MGKFQSFERLSLNQATTKKWTLPEAVAGCVRAEIPWIGLWRDKIAEVGLKESSKLIRDAGLQVSGIIKGGLFPSNTANEWQKIIDENKHAIEESAELGTKALVMVGGGLTSKDVDYARKQFEEGIAEILPFAKTYGVKLGIEPLHPMFAADRSVIVSLAQANKIAKAYQPDEVGVIIDVYHVWWDPDLYNQIAIAGEHILGFHVSDWIVPMPDMLNGRGMMGDGVIEIGRIRRAVETAGYTGPIEVEIFNQKIWNQPGDEVLKVVKDSYLEHV